MEKHNNLRHIECDPACGFNLTAPAHEIIKLSMMHADMSHADMHLSEADVEKMVKDV